MSSYKNKKFFLALDDHMVEVVRGAGVTFMIKGLSALFSFGFTVLLARFLGAGGAGIYFLALTFTTLMATVGRFGLENTILRFVASHSANNEWGRVNGAFRKGILISLVVSLFSATLLFVLAPVLAVNIFSKPDLAPPLKVMSLSVVPFALFWLMSEALKGLGRIRDSQLVQGFALPALTFLGIMVVGGGYGPTGAAAIFLFSACIALLLGGILWWRAVPIKKVAYFSTVNLFGSCVPLLWVQIMKLLLPWTSILLLGIWGTEAEIGILGAASRTAMLISLILMSVNAVIAPKFAVLYSKGDLSGLAAIARKSIKMMLAIASPILFIFLLIPEFIMTFFGKDFVGAGPYLVIFALGEFVNVSTGSGGYLLMMTGNEKLLRNNTLFTGILVVLVNFLLIPHWGAMGAAVATSLSLAVSSLGEFYLVWKKLGIWTFPIGKFDYLNN